MASTSSRRANGGEISKSRPTAEVDIVDDQQQILDPDEDAGSWEVSEKLEKALVRKVDLRLCSIAGILCSLNLLDSGIISSASVTSIFEDLELGVGNRYVSLKYRHFPSRGSDMDSLWPSWYSLLLL